jgi:CheY-like chemotaxis protein
MDDEVFIRKLAADMLQKMGYTVKLAKDGHEAIQLYKQSFEAGQAFDAVILDLTIPGGMGGKETIQELLCIDKKIKAIVSSGYSNDPVMSNYSRYGFKKAVKKPYLIQEIGEALQSIIPQKKTS